MSGHQGSFRCFGAVPASRRHAACSLPRIPHPDAAESADCYLCSERRRARATAASPPCPYDDHLRRHRPHRQRRRPGGADEPPPRAKRLVLVKNSEPSFRKTVVLHRKGLRSFALFLEEVSELMQYRVRRLYTLDGHEVENVQSIIHCPNVLVCVGREPSHPSIVERFCKTAEDKLPKLSAKARSTGDDANQSTRPSVSSDKSLDDVGSAPSTAGGTPDDDVEKLVRVNKDGSLSMKMKVRFRLDNNETLLWSTEVRKSSTRASEHPQELGSGRSCSGSENFSTGEQVETYVTRRHQRRAEGYRYPHCYNIWANVASTQGDSCGVQTSSSSASSHTVVSRKTVVQRSSEENAEQVVEQETCVKASETVEYSTIRPGSCTLGNYEQKEPESAVDGDNASLSATRPPLQTRKPQHEEATESAGPRKSSSASSDTKRCRKMKTSKKSYTCHCGISKDDTEMNQEETDKIERQQSAMSVKSNVTPNAQREGEEEEGSKSAMSARSNASAKCEPDVLVGDERPPSHMSVKSEVQSEQCQSKKEAAEERPQTSLSSKSKTSVSSQGSAHVGEEKGLEELAKEKDVADQSESRRGQRTQSQTSVPKTPKQSVSDQSEVDSQGESKMTGDAQERASSVRSSISNVTGGTQERSASAVSAPSPESTTSEVDDTDAMSHVDGCTRDIPVERVSSSRSLVSTTSDVRSRQSKTPESAAGGDTTEAAEDRPQSASPSVNLTSSCQSKSSEDDDDDGVVDDEWKIGAASNMSCHLEGKENFPYDEMEETPSSDQVEGNPGNRSQSKARSQSGMSGKAVKSESSTISFTSKASEQQNGSIEELTERAESVTSAKSKASKRSDKVEASQDEVTGEKADQRSRSPSIMSTKSAKSSICSRSNEDESELSVKSERSATSAKSMRSIQSSASKPGDVPAESKNPATESNIPEAPMNAVDTNERAMSAMSVQSHISTRSSKSKCSADVPAEDKSRCSEDEKTEQTEERASSCTSAKSIESHVSAVRSPSALSAKSAESRKSSKSNTSEMSTGKNIADEDAGEERDERAQSAMSAKTAKSTLSLRSTASKGAANARDREERAQSSRSVRSHRSAKSNISATAVSVNDVVSDHGADSPLDEQSESISISSLSVQSSQSDRSSRSKRTAEVRRPQSNPSDTSEVSEVVPEDVSSRTGSKLSAKSDKSNQSKVSTEENGSCHDPVERASSNLSIRSGKSASVSVASRDGSELMSEHSIEIAEIETDERVTSVASDTFARSNESAEEISERTDDDKDQEQQHPAESPVQSQASGVVEDVSENCVTSERAASSLSAKSALPASSKKSKTSALSPLYKANEMESENQDEFAERSASKASVETTRTNVSESLRSAGACEVPSEENAANEEETTPRPLSAVSAKSSTSAKSAQSISSAKSKSSIAVGENNDDSIDRAPGSTFGKSTQSRRSISSAASTKSKAVGDVFSTDDTEGRAKSVVSLLSGASKTSQRPQTECGEEECEEERAMTNKSDTSLKSTTSNVSDRRGDEGIRGTSGALSYQSSRSRTSGKISCEPSEGTDERTKSAMSNVSAKSKKSDVPVVAVEECEHRASTAMSSKSKSSATSEVLEKKSKASAKSTKSVKSRKIGILVDEEDDSQTKPISQICETLAKRDVSSEQVPNGPQDAVAVGRSDHKSDKETMHADDEALVPSSLPNASLSEVVNEWLNKIPPDEELCDMEEFCGNAVDGTNADSAAENRIKGLNDESGVSDNECQKTPEKSKADHCGDTDAKIFHSSVQVMKVLLNPKLDRCNSLPEVSPVYGNKLSTSATGLFDCLAKLQLIDSDPKNADKKCERYKALMEILQSLWLCDPLEKKPALEEKAERHSDKDFNPGSSSGIDVNSGSTGSQKSSDGRNKKQTLADTIGKAHKVHQDEEAGGEEEEHTHEENPKGEPSSDETIRGHDSPRGLRDSPPSSNKSSGTGQRLETDAICGSPLESSKQLSHDPDPVWVLSLLTKIEKQFMTHYVNAVSEFKDQWNIDDNEQLDRMIIELRDEIHRRIQISIHRELCKIQGRAGLPRPPKEPKSRPSTAQTDGRRRRLRMKTKRSGKSDDSTASTIFSDQRGENEDENCPCESCIQNKMSRGPQIPADIMNTAPVLLDFDLKRSLQMRNDEPKEDLMTNGETKAAAATLVGQILDHAIKEAVEDKVNDMEIVFEVSECERDEAMMENDSSKEDGECAVSSEDAEDEDEAKEPTVADMSQDETGGGGAVYMENETPATSADESDDASTVKDSNEGANTDDEVTAENAIMVEGAAEDAATAQEAVLAATSQQESEEDGGGGGVDGEEEPPAASGDENDDPATTSKSNDDDSPNDEEQDEEGPDIDTLEDEGAPQEATIPASADDKTQEDEEGAGDGEENDHASPVKTSNEDANAEDEVFADDGEDEDAVLEVATGARSEHVSEANEEGAGEDEEGTPATCGDDDAANEMASEEVPETTEDEDATQEAAVMATSEQESDEDEEGGVDGQAQTPDTSGAENEEAVAENQDAAEAEMRSEEVSETAEDEDAAQEMATGKGEFEPDGEGDVVNGEEETPATSGAENEDAADTDQEAEEDVAETTTVEDAVSATSERQSEEEEEGNVDSEEETPGRSGAENRDATAEDQNAANDGGMTRKEVPDAEEAATSEPESEEDKEQKVSGEEETPATSGDENNRYVDDGVAAEDEKMSDEATATAAAEDDDAAVSARSERESEEDDKVDGEEETPATSGDENDGTASKDDDDAAAENDQTNAASQVAAEDDNAAQEATVTATSDDESVNETADGDHDMSVTSGDDIEDAKDESATEKDLPASSEDDSKVETAEEEESLHRQASDGEGEEAGHEDEIIAPTDEEADDADETSTYKQDSDKAEEEQGTLSGEDSEHSVEEDPALTSDGGEDPEKDEVRAMSDEDTSKKDDTTGNTSKQEEESENEEPEAESEEPGEKDDQEATGGGSTDAAGEGCDEEEDGSNEAQVAKNDPGGAPQEDEARNGEGDVNEKSEVTKGRGPDDVSGADNEIGDHDQDEDERKVDTLEASDKEEEEPELINAASLDRATDVGAENKEKSKMGHDDKEEEEEEPKVTEKEGPANVMALGAEDNETVDDQDEDDKETSKTENGERELTKNKGPDEAAELGNESQENKDADEEDQPQGDDEHDDKETHGETFEASEKEERGPESANQGESADAEDEAESRDGEDREALSEAYDFIPGKAANWEADKSVAEEPTTLRVKTTLNKASTESEDAVYADGEDSDA
ncbi:retinitis pigmentosa 1-like 1 protein [Phyllopteryx taeniolatus]|uniref:retinitis pigmentosa 1-like 1 protein n=1 Tax=Phyllopteryx taeniolatus TaxID=161469 RepID=UPI002AD2C52D|nr:retinitis pigmentosa 1-like 1 protein [Phyllopteryx taeniolatus]